MHAGLWLFSIFPIFISALMLCLLGSTVRSIELQMMINSQFCAQMFARVRKLKYDGCVVKLQQQQQKTSEASSPRPLKSIISQFSQFAKFLVYKYTYLSSLCRVFFSPCMTLAKCLLSFTMRMHACLRVSCVLVMTAEFAWLII